MSNKFALTLLACTALTTTATPAMAGNFSPQLNGIILVELENDWAFDADKSSEEVDTLFTTIEPYLILSLNDRLAIETSLVFEPLKKRSGSRTLTKAGTDSAFENQALLVEELKLAYFGDNYTIFGGKFNPTFGTAWDLAKGIVGKDIAKDYELKERIGVGANYTFKSKSTGYHTLTANTFFLDTTFLSNSLVNDRGVADIDDGGVSNTEDPSSVSITLDTEKLGKIKGLNTHLGFYSQAVGDADDGKGNSNEQGYVIGAQYKFYPTSNKKLSTTVLGEWAGIRDSKGKDTDIDYYTGSLVVKYNKAWNLTVAHTKRHTDDNTADTSINDHQFQVSAGYLFKNGLSIDAGYRNAEKSGNKVQGLTTLLAYTYEF